MSPSRSLIVRSLGLGLATGGRTNAGIAAVALSGRRAGDGSGGLLAALTSSRARVAAPMAAAGELVVDKLPKTPSRTEPAGLYGRVVAAALAAAALAERYGAPAVVPAAVAGGAAAGAAYAGAAYRGWVARKGWPDLPAALAEDAAAAGIAYAAVRP